MRTPCSEPDANPDDWFIGRDGKQYGDEELLTEAEKLSVAKTTMWLNGEPTESHEARVKSAIAARERDKKRKSLQRRRHAREACMQCPIRLGCLRTAVDEMIGHGTWGGLFEEQIREVQDQRRNNERVG